MALTLTQANLPVGDGDGEETKDEAIAEPGDDRQDEDYVWPRHFLHCYVLQHLLLQREKGKRWLLNFQGIFALVTYNHNHELSEQMKEPTGEPTLPSKNSVSASHGEPF